MCAKCKAWKPIEEFGQYKDYYNPDCKLCRLEYNRQHEKKPMVKQDRTRYREEYRSTPEYKKHKSEYLKKRWKTIPVEKKTEWKLKAKLREQQNKQDIIKYKGGACILCGYVKCTWALHLHHLVPADKGEKFKRGNKIEWKLSLHKEEIDKCILVCANCHQEIHSGMHQDIIQGLILKRKEIKEAVMSSPD